MCLTRDARQENQSVRSLVLHRNNDEGAPPFDYAVGYDRSPCRTILKELGRGPNLNSKFNIQKSNFERGSGAYVMCMEESIPASMGLVDLLHRRMHAGWGREESLSGLVSSQELSIPRCPSSIFHLIPTSFSSGGLVWEHCVQYVHRTCKMHPS